MHFDFKQARKRFQLWHLLYTVAFIASGMSLLGPVYGFAITVVVLGLWLASSLVEVLTALLIVFVISTLTIQSQIPHHRRGKLSCQPFGFGT